MDPQTEKPSAAWQPLTPAGVAAFARTTWGRLLLVHLVTALLAATIVVCFLHARWFSVISLAIKALPTDSEIRGGTLRWANHPAMALAGNNFLALCVDPNHQGLTRSPAHIQVEFGQNDIRVLSLFGCWQAAYPRHWTIAFKRPELEPWWGAWAPALLLLAGTGVLVALMAIWTSLALLYAPVAWLVAFFNDRQLSLAGSWRLAGAALMPGALLLNAGLGLYTFGLLDVIQLLAVTAVHFVISWVYLVYGALRLPLHPSTPAVTHNPFGHSETAPMPQAEGSPEPQIRDGSRN